MPARICPDCGRPHNHTTHLCTTCYQSRHQSRGRRYGRHVAAPPCGDGLCGNPATEARLVTVGLRDHGVTRDSGWLFLCPSCASLFDQEEARPLSPVVIPSRAAARGSIYC